MMICIESYLLLLAFSIGSITKSEYIISFYIFNRIHTLVLSQMSWTDRKIIVVYCSFQIQPKWYAMCIVVWYIDDILIRSDVSHAFLLYRTLICWLWITQADPTMPSEAWFVIFWLETLHEWAYCCCFRNFFIARTKNRLQHSYSTDTRTT